MVFDDARGELRSPPGWRTPRRKWNDETGSWEWESDDESNEEWHTDWETDYQVIEKREKGYATVPEIVLWNLRHSRATPVPARQKEVALVSGFSKNMVKLFSDDGIACPEQHVMEAAIHVE